MKTRIYKAKIQDVKSGYVRFKNVQLTNEKYIEMLKQLNKINSNGFKLLDVWEV